MQILHIDFQEGFADDTVVVRINGVETVRNAHVSTRMQLGYAWGTSVSIPEGSVIVEVMLANTGARARTELQVHGEMWLGVNVCAAGAIRFTVSDTPFGYV